MAKSAEDVETVVRRSVADERLVIRNGMRLVKGREISTASKVLIFSTKLTGTLLTDMNLLWSFAPLEKRYKITIQMETSKQVPSIFQIADESQTIDALRITSKFNCRY
jgi:hypothetical protein